MPHITEYPTLAKAYVFLIVDNVPGQLREEALTKAEALLLDGDLDWGAADAELDLLSEEDLEHTCCGERGDELVSHATNEVLEYLFEHLP